MNEKSRQKAWILTIIGVGLFLGPMVLNHSFAMNAIRGIPTMFFYIFIIWLIYIGLIAMVNKNG